MEENLEPKNEINNETPEKTIKSNSSEIEVNKIEEINQLGKVVNTNENVIDSKKETVSNVDIKSDIDSESKKEPVSKVEIKSDIDSESKKETVSNVDIKSDIDSSNKSIPKPKKELPLEKKPFQEFINIHLIPALTDEINQRGLKIINIYLENTHRPIAGDKCWVISCEIKDTCNFWLSFEKEDISSLKSISLSKPNQTPSIIESFLIDEKRITLKLIISRVLQRLNGQKLIGVN